MSAALGALSRLEAHPVHPQGTESPDSAVERGEDVARVRAALDGLSERDRAMLLARYEGFSYRELADAFDVAPGSVGTLLARAERRFVGVFEPAEETNDASG